MEQNYFGLRINYSSVILVILITKFSTEFKSTSLASVGHCIQLVREVLNLERRVMLNTVVLYCTGLEVRLTGRSYREYYSVLNLRIFLFICR